MKLKLGPLSFVYMNYADMSDPLDELRAIVVRWNKRILFFKNWYRYA